MGSALYISVDVRHVNDPRINPKHWAEMFEGPSKALERGTIVDAFGDCDPDAPIAKASGYLSHDEWKKMAEHPECPWRLDEPYWIRRVDGPEFVAIVREKRWQKLEDADFRINSPDPVRECSAELRAYAAMVESLLADGCEVHVWCWHSQ